jgi:hypothetical protein
MKAVTRRLRRLEERFGLGAAETEFSRRFRERIEEGRHRLCSWAGTIGVVPNTLLRWMKLPEFQAAYREARRAAFAQAIARLQQGASAAATTLLKTMIDPATLASVRVRAAECVMNQATKAIEIEDIEVRVTALDAAAASGEQRR